MIGELLRCSRDWEVLEPIGSGGFGQVYSVRSVDGSMGAAKLVPKDPGADREVLFAGLDGVSNVIPLIDHGEYGGFWVLVMPRAEHSLRDHMRATDGPLPLSESVSVLADVCAALADLAGNVVHRDLKPENVLFWEGRWCIADFGISRYAEATTAADTQKFAMSPPYAAPERWRAERATSATDVYALGCMAFEVLTAARPFEAASMEEWREAHLHGDPRPLEGVPSALASLIRECLYKAPESRPAPGDLCERLGRAAEQTASTGLARLQEANQEEVARRSDAARQQSIAQSASERHAELLTSAQASFAEISSALLDAIRAAAPAATINEQGRGSWTVRLSEVQLTMSRVGPGSSRSAVALPFDVVASADLNLRMSTDQFEYEGRSHSLWYGDIREEGRYGWFETAFMHHPLMGQRGRQEPFALDPGREALEAVGPGMGTFQVAWPFMPLQPDGLSAFIDRWGGWLAEAAQGRLQHPPSMPEGQPAGSWRA